MVLSKNWSSTTPSDKTFMMIFFLTELVVCVRSVDISMCVCLYSAKKSPVVVVFVLYFFARGSFPKLELISLLVPVSPPSPPFASLVKPS